MYGSDEVPTANQSAHSGTVMMEIQSTAKLRERWAHRPVLKAKSNFTGFDDVVNECGIMTLEGASLAEVAVVHLRVR